MRRRLDPNRIVLGMVPRACKECTLVQHVFFTSTEEYDAWECPECRKKLDNDVPDDVESDET